MRLYRPGFPARFLYPDAIFRVKTTDRNLYLTFDDGPDPLSTPQLLGILNKHGIKAVFFCNGICAEKHPDLINEILESGHIIGNHTYNHADGWRTGIGSYINDINKAAPLTSDHLFRPPYGHLKLRQYREVRKNYQIILWDVMPYDFDKKFGKDRSLKVLKEKIRPGSVIVLHDKKSSNANLFLEDFIIYARGEGYDFQTEIK